jgi:hypothetical protein
LQLAIRHWQPLLFRIENTTLSAGMSIAYFIPLVQANSTLWVTILRETSKNDKKIFPT